MTVPEFSDEDFDNLELVREIVFLRLRDDNNWHQFEPQWDGSNQNKYVTFQTPRLRDRFTVLVNEVMWGLIIQGVIAPGKNAANQNLPFFRITTFGKKVLSEDRFAPHDPTNYIAGISRVVGPTVSSVPISYLREALRCFGVGCHAASVLLLGIAAEAIFLEFCRVMESALTEEERKKFEKLQHIKQMHKFVVERYENLPRDEKRKLPESLGHTLSSLYDHIRRQRNELGHPQRVAPDISREQSYVFFQLFPTFISDIEAYAKYLRT